MLVTPFQFTGGFTTTEQKKKNPIAIHFGVGVRNFKGAGLVEGSHFVNIAVWRSNRPGAHQRDRNFSRK